MMVEISKGKSPFYPGQPVPVELFAGRSGQIDRIVTRGVRQVAEGKPIALYVQGEYGIGKSSIASFVQWLAEKEYGLLGVYASLGGARDLTDVATAILQATVRSGIWDTHRAEKIRNWLAKYIGKQDLFGFTLNFEAIKSEAPHLASAFGLLQFLSQALDQLRGDGFKGIFLILDEINGITADPQFAHFIKGIVDTNSPAIAKTPIPLLLMLCGVEERRRDMIQKHQPVDRIFDVIDIETMNRQEMESFFTRAFQSVQMTVKPEAMAMLIHYSAGFPKIMHVLGDTAYWLDKDGVVDKEDADRAVFAAADEIGKKYVDQQVYKALRSDDYQSILGKIAAMGPDKMAFTKDEVASALTASERGKLHNFLQKMKKLTVIRPGDHRGEYVFNLRMVRLYIWLRSLQKTKGA